MTLEEAILHAEEVAEAEEQKYKDWKGDYSHLKKIDSCLECANEHRQLAEWLREVEESRKVIDVFLQTFVNFDLDMCCDDLINDDDEELTCMENCNNKTKDCWLRWAKLKAREGGNSE
jgi:hypothetical protein